MCSSTFSLTLAPEGMDDQRKSTPALPSGMTRYPLYRRPGGPQCRSTQVRKI